MKKILFLILTFWAVCSFAQPFQERDPRSIWKNGSTVTNQCIPFAEGISLQADNLYLSACGSGSYINSSNGISLQSVDGIILQTNGDTSNQIFLNDDLGIIYFSAANYARFLGTDVIIDGIGANKLAYTDGSEIIGGLSIGTNLEESSGSLQTTANPIFDSITIGGAGDCYDDGDFYCELLSGTQFILDGPTLFAGNSTIRGNLTIAPSSITTWAYFDPSSGDTWAIRNFIGGLSFYNQNDGTFDFLISSTGAVTLGRGSIAITLYGNTVQSGTLTTTTDDNKFEYSGSGDYGWMPGLIYENASSNIGNVGGGEDNLHIRSTPKNTLNTDGQSLRWKMWGTFAANVNTKRIRCYFGSSSLIDTTALAFNGSDWKVEGTIIRTGATSQKAVTEFSSSDALLHETIDVTTPGATLSSPNNLYCTGESGGAATNDIISNSFLIWRDHE